MKSIKAKLIANGWQYICSIMHDTPKNGSYGLLFIKEDEKFYLNKDTFNKLPTENRPFGPSLKAM
jgi:hypothetical protein